MASLSESLSPLNSSSEPSATSTVDPSDVSRPQGRFWPTEKLEWWRPLLYDRNSTSATTPSCEWPLLAGVQVTEDTIEPRVGADAGCTPATDDPTVIEATLGVRQGNGDTDERDARRASPAILSRIRRNRDGLPVTPAAAPCVRGEENVKEAFDEERDRNRTKATSPSGWQPSLGTEGWVSCRDRRRPDGAFAVAAVCPATHIVS